MRKRPRLLLSCTCEDRADFHARVEMLLGSARRLGGSLAFSPLVVNVVGGADPAFAARVQALGAEVRVVARAPAGAPPHANKLCMLSLHDRDDFDVLLAVDCDVAIARDPAPLIGAGTIGVVPADTDPLGESQWHALLAALRIEPGPRRVHATTTGRPMYPYFNSGVVTVPRALCAELLARWTDALHELTELWPREPRLIPRSKRFFTDQYALMAALRRGGLPWAVASRELNFPTHVPLHGPTVAGLKPALLHYHSEFDEHGLLFRPRCAVAETAADLVNRSHSQAAGIPYRGLRSRPLHGHAHLAVTRLGERGRGAKRRLRGTIGARGA